MDNAPSLTALVVIIAAAALSYTHATANAARDQTVQQQLRKRLPNRMFAELRPSGSRGTEDMTAP
jgi:hypothetical protein